jgi:carbon storage regulator
VLILQRKPGESVRIGDNITVSVVSVDSGRVRIAIDAPTEIPILRSELIEAIAVNQDSVVSETSANELRAFFGHVFESTDKCP